MDRSQKEDLVQCLRASLLDAAVVIVTQQVGLTVSEVTELRRGVREVEASYRVVKNNLARLAVRGTVYEGISQYLYGPTALAFSSDPIAAAKAVVKYADMNDKMKVVGGMMGEKSLSSAAIYELAKLPGLDILRSQLIGLVLMPATNIARITIEPGSRIARVLSARV